MQLNKDQKIQLVKKLTQKAKDAKSILIMGFKGTKNADLQALGKKLRENKIEMSVVKNSLLRRVMENVGFELTKENTQVPLAIIFSLEDEIAPAKIVVDASRENQNVIPISGIFEGKVVDARYIAELAKLSSRDELYTKLVATIKGPITRMQNVLRYNLATLVTVLNNKIKQ